MIEDTVHYFVGFDYWDKSGWKSLAEKVKELAASSQKILEVYRYILDNHVGKSLKSLDKSEARFYYGGMGKEEDDKSVRAYRLMKDLFGVYIDKDLFVSEVGIEGKNPSDLDIEVEKTEKPDFITLTEKVRELSEKILTKLEEYPGQPSDTGWDVKNVFRDDKALVNLVNGFFEALARVQPHTSNQVFFSFSTRLLPGDVAEEAYSRIKEDEVRKFLGLEQAPWVVEPPEASKLFYVYKHVKGGLLDSVYRLGCIALDVLSSRDRGYGRYTFSRYIPKIEISSPDGKVFNSYDEWVREQFKEFFEVYEELISEYIADFNPADPFSYSYFHVVFKRQEEKDFKVAGIAVYWGEKNYKFYRTAEVLDPRDALRVILFPLITGRYRVYENVSLESVEHLVKSLYEKIERGFSHEIDQIYAINQQISFETYPEGCPAWKEERKQ